jgi:hypothetical protein
MFKKDLLLTLVLAPMARFSLPYGGFATTKAINGGPSVFAAAFPMASMGYTGIPEQVAQLDKVNLPIMFTTSTYDLHGPFDQTDGTIGSSFNTQISLFSVTMA